MGGVQVLAALVGIFILDKIGRRPLLIWGAFAQGASMFMMFAFIEFGLKNYVMIPVLLFNISFVLGLGGLNLVYTTEIVNPKAVGICVSCQYITSAIIGKFTPGVLDRFGSSPVIFFYGVACMVVCFISSLYFVESQGKTEMEIYFEISKLKCGGVLFAQTILKDRMTTVLRV